jgi:hypothetical protein
MFKNHIKIMVIFMDIEVPDAILLKSEMTERQLQLEDYHPSEIFEYIKVHLIGMLVTCCDWVIHLGISHIVSFRITTSPASFSQKTIISPFLVSNFLATLDTITIFMPFDTVAVPKIFTNVLMYGKLYIPSFVCVRTVHHVYHVCQMG